MNRHFRRLCRVACWLAPLSATACGVPLATLHGPAPVPVNSSVATVGLGPIFLDGTMDEDLLLFNAIFGAYGSVRQGITDRLEVGASAGMFNGVTAEAKYNLVPGPLVVSANLAVSGGLVVDLWGSDDAADVLGIHPALLVGTERVYGGAKLMTFPSNVALQPWQVVFAGGLFGRGATQVVAEIGHLRDPADGETTWFGGVGLRRSANLGSLW